MLQVLGNTGIKITPIIVGCWQVGGAPHWQGIDDATSEKTIIEALDSGITTFDTAPGYGNGHSEILLGKTLKPYRKNVVIATKVFADKLSYDQVLKSCENSLKNLQTDYIDLFQIHFPSGTFGSTPIPIDETLSAFLKLKTEGKIRAIGVSNFSLAQLKTAYKYTEIDSIQPPYSLFWRSPVNELGLYCRANNISILAYSPLAQGLLTGKFGRDYKFPNTEVRSQQILCEPEHYNRVQNALDRLRPIAESNHMNLTELALVWIISQAKTSAIVGMRTPEQARSNAKVMHSFLPQEVLEAVTLIGQEVSEPLKSHALMWNF